MADTRHTTQQALLEGNARYVQGTSIAQNPPEARSAMATGQSPVAAVVCCSDSRSVPEIVFDQSLGSLFTCAIAGNVVTTEVLESLTYAVDVLGVPLIVVMGHSGCGAVTAAVAGQAESNGLACVAGHIDVAGETDVNAAIALHVSAMVTRLRGAFDVEVAGVVHDVASGQVSEVATP